MPLIAAAANRVKQHRDQFGWSQAELAFRAGISRAAVSAIEINRLVPSVAAALSLAATFGCSVEDLFGEPSKRNDTTWAWPCPAECRRFWQARIGDRTLLYPLEPTLMGAVVHDGVIRDGVRTVCSRTPPEKTLVLACCDPAVSILAQQFARESGFRLLALPRSSGQALELLRQGVVHVAGVHLSANNDREGNARIVKERIEVAAKLLRVAVWDEGLALGSGVASRSVSGIAKSRVEWVGREPGSGARACLDQILNKRTAPRRVAFDHRGVAEAIRCGWADVGVCLRLSCEEAGLRFLAIREEPYDLCYASRDEGDPRLQALVAAVRSAFYRNVLGELPGYDARDTGTIQST
jgi:molybdate-binding protein/DNA-binding XRE family transcriptional regulator